MYNHVLCWWMWNPFTVSTGTIGSWPFCGRFFCFTLRNFFIYGRRIFVFFCYINKQNIFCSIFWCLKRVYPLGCVDFDFLWKKCSAWHFILEGAILWCHNKFEVNPIQFAPPMGGTLKNQAFPYKSKIWNFWNIGVAIYSELYFEILRPMVKKVTQLNLPFLSYGQKTAIFFMKKAFFWQIFNIVSLIELNPSPWVLEFLYTTLEKDLAQLGLLFWRNSQN